MLWQMLDLLDGMGPECDCIAYLEDLGSIANRLLIYRMVQHNEPDPATSPLARGHNQAVIGADERRK